jgi:hypothetical protein
VVVVVEVWTPPRPLAIYSPKIFTDGRSSFFVAFKSVPDHVIGPLIVAVVILGFLLALALLLYVATQQ